MPKDVTDLLSAWIQGDSRALDELTPLVYADLLRISKARLRKERPGHTLATAGLVNEVFLRLIDGSKVNWQSRQHFFKVASLQMGRILTDHARTRQRKKRGAGEAPLSLEVVNGGDFFPAEIRPEQLIDLEVALDRFREFDEKKAELVAMRFYAGLSIDELAELLEVSPATIKRHLKFARTWLAREMKRQPTVPKEP